MGELDEVGVPKSRGRSYSDSVVDWNSTETKEVDLASGSTTADSRCGTPTLECVDVSSSEDCLVFPTGAPRPRLNTEPIVTNSFCLCGNTQQQIPTRQFQGADSELHAVDVTNLSPRPMLASPLPLSCTLPSPAMHTMYFWSVNPDGTQVLVPMSSTMTCNLPSWSVPPVVPAVAVPPPVSLGMPVKLGALLPENDSSDSLETRAAALSAYAAEVRAQARRAKAAAVAARRKVSNGQAQTRHRAATIDGFTGMTKEMLDASTSEVIDEGSSFVDVTHVRARWDDREDIENDDRTTLMFRNLPNNYTRSSLLAMLDAEGFNGDYSFVYLPTDFKNFAGFGYAFVNFARHEGAKRAKQHFQGFARWNMPSRKVCDTVWSGPVQGLQAHTERYRNSPVMHDSVPDEYKPVVFVNGVRAPFPVPTKRIRPPRVRQPIADEVPSGDGTSRRSRAQSEMMFHH